MTPPSSVSRIPVMVDNEQGVGASVGPGSQAYGPEPATPSQPVGADPSRTEVNPFLVQAIDDAIDAAWDAHKDVLTLQIAESMWAGFKGSVPRKERRQRQGTRFVNAYRTVRISIHPEWEWGWRLVVAGDEMMEVSA